MEMFTLCIIQKCTGVLLLTFLHSNSIQFPKMCCDWVNSMLVALLASHLLVSFACRFSQALSPEKSSSGTWGTIRWCPLLAGRDQMRWCDTVWLEMDKMHYFGVIYKVRMAALAILDHEIIKVLLDALSIFEPTRALVKHNELWCQGRSRTTFFTWGHIWQALVWRCMMLSGSVYHRWNTWASQTGLQIIKSLAYLGTSSAPWRARTRKSASIALWKDVWLGP